MSVQDWGAIGEILGSVAIFVTLIYLANQVRYARLATIDTNRTSRVEGVRELNSLMITQADLRAAWNKSGGPLFKQMHAEIAELLSLDADETALVILQGFNWSFTHWSQFRSMKSQVDEAELTNIVRGFYGENPMKALIDHPIFRMYLDPEFVEWLDKTLLPRDK